MLPPDIAAKLHECVTHDFIAARDVWFVWLSRSTKCVVLGLILELPELAYETTDFARNRIDRFRYRVVLLEHRLEEAKILAVFGWFLIVAGVAGEWYSGTKIDDLSARIQGCNDAKLVEVTEEAGSAKDSAKEARDAAREAREASDKAVAESSSAMTSASGARSEADSFETDIKSAKKQATEAESHLAEATKSANILTAKLERLTTPRRLPGSAQVIAPLKTFTGTEYVFIGTCGDQECFDVLSDIDEVLKRSGWKRVKGPPMRIGISQVLVHEDKDFAVDINVSTGIQISAEAPNGIESLKSIPENQFAAYIRAAMALNKVLSLNISPPENTGRLVAIQPGTSTVVRIDVGRKPL